MRTMQRMVVQASRPLLDAGVQQPSVDDGDSHFLSTRWPQSGILGNVHSERSWKTEVWQLQSPKSAPNRQPPEAHS